MAAGDGAQTRAATRRPKAPTASDPELGPAGTPETPLVARAARATPRRKPVTKRKPVAKKRKTVARRRKRKPYTIGTKSLRKVCPNLYEQEARVVGRALAQAMSEHGINTPNRAAMFIAQCAHESGGFVYTRELWGPTPVQRTYPHMLGNRGMGDAFRYRGGGYIQLTGRSNYAAASRALGLPLLKKPQLLNQHRYAAKVAAWWWQEHGLNQLASGGPDNFVRVTRTINGGINGLADRQAYYARARPVAEFLIPKRR